VSRCEKSRSVVADPRGAASSRCSKTPLPMPKGHRSSGPTAPLMRIAVGASPASPGSSPVHGSPAHNEIHDAPLQHRSVDGRGAIRQYLYSFTALSDHSWRCERIEILPDGASAIYGSDAVAGVVNFIMRPDYHGQETTLRAGKHPRRCASVGSAQSFGAPWASGGALVEHESLQRHAVATTDRDFSQRDTTDPLYVLEIWCPGQQKQSAYAQQARAEPTHPRCLATVTMSEEGRLPRSGMHCRTAPAECLSVLPSIPGSSELHSGVNTKLTQRLALPTNRKFQPQSTRLGANNHGRNLNCQTKSTRSLGSRG